MAHDLEFTINQVKHGCKIIDEWFVDLLIKISPLLDHIETFPYFLTFYKEELKIKLFEVYREMNKPNVDKDLLL